MTRFRIWGMVLAVGGSSALLACAGCAGDPNDPHTWAKKLHDLRDQKEALNHLASMDVERARVVLPDLINLYKETHNPDHLEMLVRYRDPSTKALFIEALDYTDEDFGKAVVAAGALADMKATDAVEALATAAAKPLTVKSLANRAKWAAERALIKIGDPRAIPTLTTLLTTSADVQDFQINRTAALGLAEFRDPASVPSLIKGLFMTGRGAGLFQECRLALVRIGEPAVNPLIALLQGKNSDVRLMARTLKFDEKTPGVVPQKAAWVLGDLRAKKAVGALVDRLQLPSKGSEHGAILIALGQIGTPEAVAALVTYVKDGKARPGLRASAANGLYLSGDKQAVAPLMDIARNGYVTGPDGEKASDLRASAAIDLARIAGPESYADFKALVDKENEAEGPFGEALDRMNVAKDCGTNLACYGKTLQDPSWTRAEKAAFAIGFSGDPAGLPLLLGALRPLASLTSERFPVHQAILYSLTRLATHKCQDCVDHLRKQIEHDENAVRIPGARDLLAETQVALAIIQNR